MTKRKIPTVRIASPSDRPIQLRYICPIENREIRISTKTRDEHEAQRQKKELEAKLLLGLEAKPRQVVKGPQMAWADFRHEYSRLKVSTFLSENSMYTAEMRLDVCESIIRPRTLGKMAAPDTLARLQAELLAGAESKKEKRSPNTVESYVRTLQAALNWGHKLGWLPDVLHLDFDVDDDSETLKGRPLTVPEFNAMLAACDKVCKQGPGSWKFLLRGLWESGLRLAEAMHLSWDDETFIVPLRTRRGGYLLKIQADCRRIGSRRRYPQREHLPPRSTRCKLTPELVGSSTPQLVAS